MFVFFVKNITFGAAVAAIYIIVYMTAVSNL